MMLNLARVIKPWKEADALSAHINLYGFWTETTFLTKSGDLGMVLSVAGVDYETSTTTNNSTQSRDLSPPSSPSAKASTSINISLRRTGPRFRSPPTMTN
jgi:hypothetical protein